MEATNLLFHPCITRVIKRGTRQDFMIENLITALEGRGICGMYRKICGLGMPGLCEHGNVPKRAPEP